MPSGSRNDAGTSVLSLDVPSAQLPAATRSIAAVLALAVAALLAALPSVADARPHNGQLLYQARNSSQGYFFLRDANGRKLASVQPAQAAVAQPAASPLGQRLAFASGGQLWISQADGSLKRQLTADPIPSGSPAWSPDGGSLVFARGSVGARDLYTIGADGNDLRRLTFGGADEWAPSWSSAGRIAFVRRMPARRYSRRHRVPANDDLFAVNADGSRTARLTRDTANDRYPSWSPNAKQLAFTRRVGHHDEVFVMRADGSRLRQLTTSADATSPTWSPDGRWIAYTGGRRPHRAIFVVRASGRGHARRVTPKASDASTPSWLVKDPDPVIAAAGDIACDPQQAEFNGGLQRQCHQMETSNLLLKMDLWKVLALGDLQYLDGTYDKILQSFDPSWGRLKPLIEPVIGNHDYRDPGAAGLYQYFYGDSTQRDKGYYSFDVGTWHIIALDSDCADTNDDSCAAGSAQEQWLRADLAAHPNACTLAMMHHPLVSSGLVTPFEVLRPLYQDLYDGGADVVLAGHDHAYERFAPQDPGRNPDSARGFREFVVGTGGKALQGTVSFHPTSIVRQDDTFGVLQLTLHPDSYDWRFVPDLTSGTFTDSGTAECH